MGWKSSPLTCSPVLGPCLAPGWPNLTGPLGTPQVAAACDHWRQAEPRDSAQQPLWLTVLRTGESITETMSTGNLCASVSWLSHPGDSACPDYGWMGGGSHAFALEASRQRAGVRATGAVAAAPRGPGAGECGAPPGVCRPWQRCRPPRLAAAQYPAAGGWVLACAACPRLVMLA